MPEQFIPTDEEDADDVVVPFFEKASKSEHGVKGKSTKKSEERLKNEIRNAVAQLGGSVRGIKKGKFPGDPKRYGYVVEFDLGGHPGEIAVAALPIENETERRKEQALKQALFTVRDSLEAQKNLKLLSPGSNPLLPYLLADGERTVAELYEENNGIPQLSSGRNGDDIEEAEYEIEECA